MPVVFRIATENSVLYLRGGYTNHSMGAIPLKWMCNEAAKAHLRINPLDHETYDRITIQSGSFGFAWQLLELLPTTRLNYKGAENTTM
jgi:hypothetical protein